MGACCCSSLAVNEPVRSHSHACPALLLLPLLLLLRVPGDTGDIAI
jgi:hypothetical protein